MADRPDAQPSSGPLPRPYTLLSCGISLDGYLDDGSTQRLLLSNDADLDRVDEVRAGCDAVLVGAGTVRNDNPRLLVRSERLRRERTARGLSPTPLKVTVTRSGRLDPESEFFRCAEAERLVYCPTDALTRTREQLRGVATVVDGGREVEMRRLGEDLYVRGVRRLMVEGGGDVHTQFLTGDLADELQLVVAPLFVGNPDARRFVGSGRFPWHPGRRAELAEVRRIGDVVLLRYALSVRFCAAD